jgi:hypothetical protein
VQKRVRQRVIPIRKDTGDGIESVEGDDVHEYEYVKQYEYETESEPDAEPKRPHPRRRRVHNRVRQLIIPPRRDTGDGIESVEGDDIPQVREYEYVDQYEYETELEPARPEPPRKRVHNRVRQRVIPTRKDTGDGIESVEGDDIPDVNEYEYVDQYEYETESEPKRPEPRRKRVPKRVRQRIIPIRADTEDGSESVEGDDVHEYEYVDQYEYEIEEDVTELIPPIGPGESHESIHLPSTIVGSEYPDDQIIIVSSVGDSRILSIATHKFSGNYQRATSTTYKSSQLEFASFVSFDRGPDGHVRPAPSPSSRNGRPSRLFDFDGSPHSRQRISMRGGLVQDVQTLSRRFLTAESRNGEQLKPGQRRRILPVMDDREGIPVPQMVGHMNLSILDRIMEGSHSGYTFEQEGHATLDEGDTTRTMRFV